MTYLYIETVMRGCLYTGVLGARGQSHHTMKHSTYCRESGKPAGMRIVIWHIILLCYTGGLTFEVGEGVVVHGGSSAIPSSRPANTSSSDPASNIIIGRIQR